jgi:hypothetical protein
VMPLAMTAPGPPPVCSQDLWYINASSLMFYELTTIANNKKVSFYE